MWLPVSTWRMLLIPALVFVAFSNWRLMLNHRQVESRGPQRGFPSGSRQAEGSDHSHHHSHHHRPNNPSDSPKADFTAITRGSQPIDVDDKAGGAKQVGDGLLRAPAKTPIVQIEEGSNLAMGGKLAEGDTSRMKTFFFPQTYEAEWRPNNLKLGAVNFLLYAGEFYTNGAIPGNESAGQRAALQFKLWHNSTLGDGANFHGQAAEMARTAGIGIYKFPPEIIKHLPEEPQNLRYRSCAVVGNSGVLLEGQLGAEIDSHDAVIRMNAAPIKGYERHVGSVTSYGFLNHVHFKTLATSNFARAQKFASDKGRLVVFESMNYQAYYRLYNNLVSRFPPKELALLIVSPDFASATYELWTRISSLVMQEEKKTYAHTKPSTGWFTMVFAAQMCDKVAMYGFEAVEENSRNSKPTRCHYFDRQRCFTNVHSFELSVKVFKRLRAIGFNLTLADPVKGIRGTNAP